MSQGARLVGSYDSVVAFAQKRSLIVWQRIIGTDGSRTSSRRWRPAGADQEVRAWIDDEKDSFEGKKREV